MFGEYSLASLTKEYRVGLEKILDIYCKQKKAQLSKLMTDQQLNLSV
jgi:hypothetical protein